MQGIELCAWVIAKKYVVMDELWPAGHSGKAPDIGRQAAGRDGLGRQQVAGRRAKGTAAQCLGIAVEHHVPYRVVPDGPVPFALARERMIPEAKVDPHMGQNVSEG